MASSPDGAAEIERQRAEIEAAFLGRFSGHVTGTEVITRGEAPGQRVAVLFSCEHFPGVRFGHRFPADPDIADPGDLKEEIECGALHRMMQDPPAAGEEGIIWTTWEDPDPD